MPVPLSGLQRVVLSAANYLYQGYDAAETATYVQRTFDYLTPQQVSDVVSHAQSVRLDARNVVGGNASDNLGDRLESASEGGANRVADVRFSFTDVSGAEQWRTVRVRWTPGMTVAEFAAEIDRAARLILGGESLTGSDTVSLVPPGSFMETFEVVALL